MTCKSCNGTKRILLLEKYVDCLDCNKSPPFPFPLYKPLPDLRFDLNTVAQITVSQDNLEFYVQSKDSQDIYLHSMPKRKFMYYAANEHGNVVLMYDRSEGDKNEVVLFNYIGDYKQLPDNVKKCLVSTCYSCVNKVYKSMLKHAIKGFNLPYWKFD